MRKTRLLIGSGLLLLLPAAVPAQEVDLFNAGVARQAPAAEGLLDGKPIELKVDLPDFPAAQDDAKKEKQKKEEEKIGLALLPESIRKDFAAFAAKVGDLRRFKIKPDLEKAVRELKEKARLDEAGAAKLDALAESAMNETMRIWEEKFAVRYAPSLLSGDPAEVLKLWKPEQFVANTANLPVTPPTRTEVWTEGLKRILTPEYHAAVEAEAKAERERVLKEADGFLADAEGRAQEIFSKVMDVQVERIFQYAQIDEAREKAIRQAAADSLKDTLRSWRKRTEKKVLEMDEKTRSQMTQRNIDLGVDPSESGNKPQENELWQTARRTILTEQERKTIEEGEGRMKQRRATALAMTVLAELDLQVGFSAAQRGQLLELAGARFLTLPVEYFEAGTANYSYLDPGTMLKKLQEIPEGKLAPLLDAAQMARWKSVGAEDLQGRNIIYRTSSSGSPAPKSTEAMDELEASRLVALKLADESAKVKQRLFFQMEGRVDTLIRVIPLPPEDTAKLRTAGKGAAELMAQESIANLDQYLVRQMKGVKPQDVAGRLAKISMPRFQDRRTQPEPALWGAAIDRLLTEPQQEIWKQECLVRQAWRYQGLSALVASEVEKHAGLSAEKNALLLTKLEGVIKTYESEISNFFSPGWQYQSYYSPVPVALLSEKEMAEIFTPKQLETVRTRCLTHASQYAEMIKQQHGQRADQ